MDRALGDGSFLCFWRTPRAEAAPWRAFKDDAVRIIYGYADCAASFIQALTAPDTYHGEVHTPKTATTFRPKTKTWIRRSIMRLA